MKKNIRLLAVVLAIGLLCAFLVSCTKTPSNSDTFKAIAQNKEYSTTDALSQYSSDERFKEVFIAYPSGKPFQIEFYVLDSADSAKSRTASTRWLNMLKIPSSLFLLRIRIIRRL